MTDLVRMRGRSKQSYEERFERYSHNADTEAERAERWANSAKRSAAYAHSASDYAREHGDMVAARHYADMEDAAEDAADAYDDYAAAARRVAEHYREGASPDENPPCL